MLQADTLPTELQGKQKGKRGDHRFKLTRLKVKSLSHVPLFVTPWTAACHAPPSMGFSRQEWGGVPFSSLGDLPDPGMEPKSPTLQTDSLPTEPSGKPAG